MATPIQTSNITPTVNLSTGASEAFEALADVGRTVEQAVQPIINDLAAQKGAKEGAAVAAGEQPYKARLTIGEAGQARARALEGAYMAGVRSDIDAKLGAARVKHAYDPEGYEAESKKIVSGFIQGAPPRFAVNVEAYGQDRSTTVMQVVASERMQRDQQEVGLAFGAREVALGERIADRVSTPGGESTPEFAGDVAEYEALIREKVANPAIAYTAEQGLLAIDKLHDTVAGAVLARDAVTTYQTKGGGLPGYAAAKKALSDEFADPQGAFSSIAPERRQRLYTDAVKQLTTVYAGDRELKRAEDAAEAEARAVAREARGEMMLGIVTGAVGVETVLASDLPAGDKAALVSAAKAQSRRDAADARSVAALEKSGRTATYQQFSDRAAAGEFDPEDAANAVMSGQLTAGQARTLQTKNDKALAPVVEGAMAPYKDMAGRPGMSQSATAAQRARAEEEAARWARMNPTAALDEQLKAGDALAKKYFGGQTSGGPKTATDDKRDRLTQLQNLEAQRKGGKISQAEYNRRRASLTK